MLNTASFVQRYDGMILSPSMRALYKETGYYNVGDWSAGAKDISEACEALVEKHFRGTRSENASPDWTILDVGCGLGSGTAQIARHFAPAHVIGLNISAEQLRYARRHNPEAEYCVMDATRLALLADSADAAISVEAAFHFSPRSDFFRAVHGVLKPGARLTLTDILFTTDAWAGGWSVPRANRLDGLDAYRSLCRETGFEVEALEDITASTWQGFCAFLRREAATTGEAALLGLAADLDRAVAVYLIARLKKVSTRTEQSSPSPGGSGSMF